MTAKAKTERRALGGMAFAASSGSHTHAFPPPLNVQPPQQQSRKIQGQPQPQPQPLLDPLASLTAAGYGHLVDHFLPHIPYPDSNSTSTATSQYIIIPGPASGALSPNFAAQTLQSRADSGLSMPHDSDFQISMSDSAPYILLGAPGGRTDHTSQAQQLQNAFRAAQPHAHLPRSYSHVQHAVAAEPHAAPSGFPRHAFQMVDKPPLLVPSASASAAASPTPKSKPKPSPTSALTSTSISTPQPPTTSTRPRSALSAWLSTHFLPSPTSSVSRDSLYSAYATEFPGAVSAVTFGRLVRQHFIGVETKKVGKKMESKYHYVGMCVKHGSPLLGVVECWERQEEVQVKQGKHGEPEKQIRETKAGKRIEESKAGKTGRRLQVEDTDQVEDEQEKPQEVEVEAAPAPALVTVTVTGTMTMAMEVETEPETEPEPDTEIDVTYSTGSHLPGELAHPPMSQTVAVQDLEESTTTQVPVPPSPTFDTTTTTATATTAAMPTDRFKSPTVGRRNLSGTHSTPPHQQITPQPSLPPLPIHPPSATFRPGPYKIFADRYLAHLASRKAVWESLDGSGVRHAVEKYLGQVHVEGQVWTGEGEWGRLVVECEAGMYSACLDTLAELCLLDTADAHTIAQVKRLAHMCDTPVHLRGTVAGAAEGMVHAAVQDSCTLLTGLVDCAQGLKEMLARKASVTKLGRIMGEMEANTTGEVKEWLTALRTRVLDRPPLSTWHTWLRRHVTDTLYEARMTYLRGIPRRGGDHKRTEKGMDAVLWDAVEAVAVPMRFALEVCEGAGCATEIKPLRAYLFAHLDALATRVHRDLRGPTYPFLSSSAGMQINPFLLRFLVQQGFFDPAAVGAVAAGRAVVGGVAGEMVGGETVDEEDEDVEAYGYMPAANHGRGYEPGSMKRTLSLAFEKPKLRDDFNVRSLPYESATAQILRSSRKPTRKLMQAAAALGTVNRTAVEERFVDGDD